MIKDMTTGSPAKILITFSLPMLLSMVFQQLYNVMDSIIAGRYIGVDALAAVGSSYPITVLFIAIATGSSIGCSVVISLLFGNKNYAKVKTAIYTTTISLTVLAIALTVIGLFSCNRLIALINTPQNIFDASALYLRIYICGILFLFLYNTATAIFNGLGDSKTPLYFLIFSSLFNIFLNLVFVRRFQLGIAGLAYATFIAQGIASILAILTLIRRVRKIKTEEKFTIFDFSLLKKMFTVAIPSIFQQSFVSVGIFMVQSIINQFGSITVAAFSSALKVSTFALMTMNALPQALSSYASQNIGAGDLNRVKQGLKICIIIAESIVVIVTLVLFIFGRSILGLFVPPGSDPEVINVGMKFLYIVVPFYCLVGIKNSCDSVLRGGGAMREFMATTFADLLLRVIFSYAFASLLGFYAVCWAYPFGWIFGSLLSIFFYFRGSWKRDLV